MPRPDPAIRTTLPDDAPAWCSFVAREQARTYADLMPHWFAAARLEAVADNAARLAAELAAGRHRAAHAEVDGEIVGIAAAGAAPSAWEVSAGHVPAPAEQELDRLYLHPDHHGTGLADRLMDAVVQPGAVYLWLIEGNARAERFYLRRGFVALEEHIPAGESWGGVPMHRMLRT